MAVLALKKSPYGASASFMVRADDESDYWCKALNNPSSPRIPINEQIAGRLGGLLGIATTGATLVKLDGIAGWEFANDRKIEPGWAHGSNPVDGAIETRTLDHRAEDDNRVRHVGFYALMDWLAGADEQWLYSGADENAYYSHDHGHYFPGGPDWTAATLAATGTDARRLAADPSGLDNSEIRRIADALEGIAKGEIDAELSKIPSSWPVTDVELDALAAFLADRQKPASDRLRALVT